MIEFEKSHQHRPQGSSQSLDDAPEELQREFEAQMRGSSGAAKDKSEDAPPLPSPFELFAKRANPPASTAAAGCAGTLEARESEALMQSLKSVVGQMMIGNDIEGSRSLRIEIDPSVLPGVSVTVSQEAGAWLAQFECTDPDSFSRLARPADEMSQRLAKTLERDTIWRVLAKGLPSTGDWQQLLQAHLELPGVEARASASH